jgi:hypothetical protein
MTDGEGPDAALAGLVDAFDLAVFGVVLGADLVEVAAFADGVDMGSDLSQLGRQEQKSRDSGAAH